MVAAVLSGNRNFEGRVHPQVKANYLASPPLVVAYALAGSMRTDITSEPLGNGKDGKPVYLGTSGGVLFYGDPNGDLVAADERSGATLWHVPTNDVIKASPITYMTGGKQVVALAVGSSIMCFGLP